jgi:hypothetical protein
MDLIDRKEEMGEGKLTDLGNRALVQHSIACLSGDSLQQGQGWH